MGVAWDEDRWQDLPRIEANLSQLLETLIRQAPERRQLAAATAQDWHRRIFQGVELPVPYFAGEIRDSDARFPELFGYEVGVGSWRGVPAAAVPERLERFEATYSSVTDQFDQNLPVGTPPSSGGWLRLVLRLAAYAHGEWVRIHPFANGNGRTARLWANWFALRYGLPPFVRLLPRPTGAAYGEAAGLSMAGNDEAMVEVFADLLFQHLGERH